jgi:hypothetical protein
MKAYQSLLKGLLLQVETHFQHMPALITPLLPQAAYKGQSLF